MFDFSPERERGVTYGLTLLGGVFLVYLAISGSPLRLLSISGLLIVLGGTAAAACIHFPIRDLIAARSSLSEVLWERRFEPHKRIHFLGALAKAVKNDGLVVLDRQAAEEDEPFLRLALQVAADGLGEQKIRTILGSEMRSVSQQKERGVKVFESLGVYAPAMGLIGTLLGLTQMLSHIGDPVALGAGMSVAVLTTLYGAALSNLFFLPVAGKLAQRIEEEQALKELTIEGVIGLSKEENPVFLEQRLAGFSTAHRRVVGL